MMIKRILLTLGLVLALASPTLAQYSTKYGAPGLGSTNRWTGTNIFSGSVSITTISFPGDINFGGDLVFEGTAFDTTLSFTDPGAARTLTLPDLSGTFFLTDAANLGTGTTSLTTTDTTDVGTYAFAPAIATLAVTDGTDTARQQIDASGILIDGDYDDNGTGVVTISTDNGLQTVALAPGSVNVGSNAGITLDSDDGTNSAVLFLDPATSGTEPKLDVTITDGSNSYVNLLNINSGTTDNTRGVNYSTTGFTDVNWELSMNDDTSDDFLVITDVADATKVLTLSFVSSSSRFTIEADSSDANANLRVEDDLVRMQTSGGLSAATVVAEARDAVTDYSFIGLQTNGNQPTKYRDYFKTLSDNTATDIALISVSDQGYFATQIAYSYSIEGATPQVVSEVMNLSCVNASDTETCDLNSVDVSTALAGGSLTCTVSVDTDETNAVMLAALCDSSLDTSGTIEISLEGMRSNSSGASTVIWQP
jgi:hypothetical protein